MVVNIASANRNLLASTVWRIKNQNTFGVYVLTSGGLIFLQELV